MSKLIGVTIGDIQGIGIEILIKEWKRKRVKNFVLVTNYILFKKYVSTKKTNIKTYKSSVKNNKLIVSKDSLNLDCKTNASESKSPSFSILKSFLEFKNNPFVR